ncbi:hypothetical protein Y1Q_0013364 [Alligator mississippiensis]|uniref:Uncharacterized protein n=1 Tax=Alligator mississippiensis TaxID=8496 RepID=A0A151NVK3_ALLMI|nr:hypothetical protein Y1Q_0013364 [Alligator mississippiensis]
MNAACPQRLGGHSELLQVTAALVLEAADGVSDASQGHVIKILCQEKIPVDQPTGTISLLDPFKNKK